MNPKRCQFFDSKSSHKCTRKLKLSNFKCRCDMWFCSLHTMPEKHNCGYDYKKENQEHLESKLQPVIASKLDRI